MNVRIIIFLLLFCASLSAQIILPETGSPNIQNFLPREYGGVPQCWRILQDPSGVMFFANTGGVFEYDGVSWRQHTPIHYKAAYGLAQDSLGRIYVSSFNELGYLTPDSTGDLKFRSLLDRLPPKHRTFGMSQSVHCTDKGVYFTAPKYIIRFPDPYLMPDSVIVTVATAQFSSFTFHVNNRVLIPANRRGILQCIGDSLSVLPGTEQFNQNKIHAIIPFNKPGTTSASDSSANFLILHGSEGLHIYDNASKSVSRWETDIDHLLAKNIPVWATFLPNGQLAIGSYRKGIFIIDTNGRLQMKIDESTGLPSNSIRNLYCDKEGNLWASTGNGYSRIEISSPITRPSAVISKYVRY